MKKFLLCTLLLGMKVAVPEILTKWQILSFTVRLKTYYVNVTISKTVSSLYKKQGRVAKCVKVSLNISVIFGVMNLISGFRRDVDEICALLGYLDS
jgi:hypothetical protein